MDVGVGIKQEPQDMNPVQDACTALLLRTETLNTIHLVTGGTLLHPTSGQMATMSLPQGRVTGQVLNLNALGAGHQGLTAAPLPASNTPIKVLFATKGVNQMRSSSETGNHPLVGTGNQALVLGSTVSVGAPMFAIKNTATAFTVSGQEPSPRKIAVISVPSSSRIPVVGQQVSTNVLTVPNNLVSKANSSIQSISPVKIAVKSSSSLRLPVQPQQPQHPVFFATSQLPNVMHQTVLKAAPLDITQLKGMPSSSAHLQILSNDGKYQLVKLVATPGEEVRAATSTAGATEPVKLFIPSSKTTSSVVCPVTSTSTQASQKTGRPLQAAQRSILPATFQAKNDLSEDPFPGAAVVQLAPGTPRKMPNGTFIMTQMTNDYPPTKSVKLDSEMFPEPSSAAQPKAAPCSANESPGQKLKRPCNCSKSQCLKLYCECFAMGEFCSNCNCNNCFNNLENEEHRQQAIRACLDRNPQAFHPKIGKSREGEVRRQHCKGCHCKRSGCQKNYCECYEAKILCSDVCRCYGCKNYESSASRKSLMHLADAAEVRVQQQLAATTRLDSHLEDLPCKPSRESTCRKLPHVLLTEDVVDAVTGCLIATAEKFESEESELSSFADAERVLLMEFGRCVERVISIAATANA